MRLFYTVFLLALCLVLSGSVLASQDTQTEQATAKPLTNADILDMLSAGISQDIVIAKITASASEFDTSPAALKVLKTANVPDAVTLAMVQAPIESRGRGLTNAEPSGLARIDCKHTDSVSVYSAPRTVPPFNLPEADSVEVFKVKCGERITLLNPSDKQGWVKIRTGDGQVGYISFAVVAREQAVEATQEGNQGPEARKKEDTQKADDDLDDCRTRSQNEYDTKMNVISTMTLAPMTRVVASNRLKQNLDSELRGCRSQYESRVKAIAGE
jgi:hypothetical protein